MFGERPACVQRSVPISRAIRSPCLERIGAFKLTETCRRTRNRVADHGASTQVLQRHRAERPRQEPGDDSGLEAEPFKLLIKIIGVVPGPQLEIGHRV